MMIRLNNKPFFYLAGILSLLLISADGTAIDNVIKNNVIKNNVIKNNVIARADNAPLKIVLDIHQAPDKSRQADQMTQTIRLWHPIIRNLLATTDQPIPATIRLTIKPMPLEYPATAIARKGLIEINSLWLRTPEDLGMVIHELTHLFQNYPRLKAADALPQPGIYKDQFWNHDNDDGPFNDQNIRDWVAEGIADYIRWAVYAGKPLSWFPKPRSKKGWRRGYQDTAGFLLWLENNGCPGIVRSLHKARMKADFNEYDFFLQKYRKAIGVLWRDYALDRGKE